MFEEIFFPPQHFIFLKPGKISFAFFFSLYSFFSDQTLPPGTLLLHCFSRLPSTEFYAL